MHLNKIEIEEIIVQEKINLEEMKKIAASPDLELFEALDFENKSITDEIAKILIKSAYMKNLNTLNLKNNLLTYSFVKSLVKSKKLPNLKNLDLSFNRISSLAIPSLVDKYDPNLNLNSEDKRAANICNISIFLNNKKWIKMFLAAKTGLVVVKDLEKEEINCSDKYIPCSVISLFAIEDFFLIKNARSGSYLIIEYEDDAIYKAEELEKEEKLMPSWCECGAELTDEDLQDWSSRSKKSFFCEACCVEQAKEEEKGKKRKYNDPASKYWM